MDEVSEIEVNMLMGGVISLVASTEEMEKKARALYVSTCHKHNAKFYESHKMWLAHNADGMAIIRELRSLGLKLKIAA